MFVRMMIVSLCLWLGSAETALGRSRPVAKPIQKTFLMWHFSPAEGASPELAARVEKLVRAQFEKRHRRVLMDGMKMDSILLVEGNEKYLRCGTGAGCLAGLAKLAGVQYVIAGEVALNKGRTSVSLVLVDASRQSVVSKAKVVSQGLPNEAHLDELEVAMFSPQRYKGSLEVLAPVEGAQVLVDGKKMGLTPLPGPLSNLSAGEHLVEVKKPGREPFAKTITIPLGKSVQVTAALPHLEGGAPLPYYKKWSFWTAAGIGVAALATAVALHYDASVLEDNAAACRQQGFNCGDENQDKADSRYLQSYVFYGLGGAGLLAAGVIVALDMAWSDQDKKPVDTSPSVGLVPTPNGLAFGATFRF